MDLPNINKAIAEPQSIKPKTTVLGIGGAGVKTVKYLSRLRGSKWLNLAVADTDENTLNEADLDNSFPVGIEWTRGMGCGGDPARGSNAFAHKTQKSIENFIAGSAMLIITGGLGGGSATGGAPVLGRLARRLKIPTIFLMTTPFAFEGQSRHEAADEGIKLLLPDTDIVIPIPNDILFSSLKSDVPAKQAFAMVDESISHAILGLAEVLRCGNILATDFADFKAILSNKKTVCRIGLGLADLQDGENRCNVAADRLLESPLLGGQSGLAEADAVIATVIGGNDLEIGEMKQSLEIMKSLTNMETRIITGINTDSLYENKIFMTLLAVSYANKEDAVEGQEQKSQRAWPPLIVKLAEEPPAELQQGELLFQSPSRGHFSKTPQNIIKGEDIDIPPFQRQGVSLEKGN